MEPPTSLLDYIPFLGLITGKQNMASPLMTRLLETCVMSLVAGGAGMYVSTKVMEVQVAEMKSHELEMQAQLVHQMDDLRADIRELRAALSMRR